MHPNRYKFTAHACCWVFTLSEGTILIGWITCIFGVIEVCFFIAGLLVSLEPESEKLEMRTKDATTLFAISLVISVILLLLGFCLLFGAYMRIMILVRLYLLFSVLWFVVTVVSVIVMIVLGNWPMIVNFISLGVNAYFLWIVWSFYENIDLEID